MKKWKRRFKQWVTDQMDLPSDVLMELPRLTMIGQLHLYIENHRGVLKFSQEELRLLLAQGQLLIRGEQFVIKTILPEELLLEGKIDSVVYLDE